MTSSQWLDMAVLSVAFVAAISGWRSGALGSLLSFIGVVLGAVAGVLLAPHIVTHVSGTRTQTLHHPVLDPGPGGDRRDRRRGAGQGGARRDPQPHAAPVRLGDRRRRDGAGRCGGGLSAGDPAHVDQPAEPGCRGARFEGAEPGGRGCAAVAEGGAQPAQGAVGHLRPTRRAGQLRPHPDHQRRRAGCRADQRPRRRRRAAKHHQDPRCGAGLPKGLGGNGFRGRTEPGDVQCARRRGSGDRHRRGRWPDVSTPRWSPTTRTPTSRSSTCRACRRRRCRSPRSPRRPAPTRWCSAIPGGGDFQATPARVRETIELKGPDIYKTKTVDREVYTIRGTVRQGNSGGPMIDRQGQVLGVVFGAAVDDAETGFVLTTREVGHQLAELGNTQPVATGVCVT